MDDLRKSLRSVIGGWFGGWVTSVADLVFPAQCVLCGGDPYGDRADCQLCQACLDAILDETRGQGACSRCALPLSPTGDCSSCRQRSYRFQETRALGIYRGGLRQAILEMKHVGKETISLALGRWLAIRMREQPLQEDVDFLVPAPMHWKRRWRRGVNSPELMSEVLGRSMRRPWYSDLIRFRRATRKQGTLLPNERWKNVRGAFGITAAYAIRGAHVLLVDDVMTTGATLNEISKALLAAGAARVSVAVAARAVGDA